jgi:hypothetical protein
MADDQAAYPLHERQILKPGWYWGIVDARDVPDFAAWQKENKGKIAITKTSTASRADEGDERPAQWILFRVDTQTIWTLPGYPVKAPLGDKTTPNDTLATNDGLMPSIFSPQHPWNKFWGLGLDTPEAERDPGKTPPANPIESLLNNVGTAGNVLIWGTALYVGFLVWRGLSPVRRVQRAAREE